MALEALQVSVPFATSVAGERLLFSYTYCLGGSIEGFWLDHGAGNTLIAGRS